jgi:hypothetical protein
MLEALLPQVSESNGQVEVWILDNCSSDDTNHFLSCLPKNNYLSIVRHSYNIGPISNIYFAPLNLARGTYTWVLGDHNLIRPRTLVRVLDRLKQPEPPTIHYTNFRCASYPDHWPKSAVGGYDGDYDYLADPELTDQKLPEWNMILKSSTSVGTQVYAHIIPTSIWKNFWKHREIATDYSDALTTYPHTAMLALTNIRNKAITIAEPTLTIFNNAQSWHQSEIIRKVYTRGLPDLIDIFAKQGMEQYKILEFKNSFLQANLASILFRGNDLLPSISSLYKTLLDKQVSIETKKRIVQLSLQKTNNIFVSKISQLRNQLKHYFTISIMMPIKRTVKRLLGLQQ